MMPKNNEVMPNKNKVVNTRRHYTKFRTKILQVKKKKKRGNDKLGINYQTKTITS